VWWWFPITSSYGFAPINEYLPFVSCWKELSSKNFFFPCSRLNIPTGVNVSAFFSSILYVKVVCVIMNSSIQNKKVLYKHHENMFVEDDIVVVVPPLCKERMVRSFFISFQIQNLYSIYYPYNVGMPFFPTETVLFRKTLVRPFGFVYILGSHHYLTLYNARQNVLLLRNDLCDVIVYKNKKASIQKRTRIRGTTFISFNSSLEKIDHYLLYPCNGGRNRQSLLVKRFGLKAQSPFIYRNTLVLSTTSSLTVFAYRL